MVQDAWTANEVIVDVQGFFATRHLMRTEGGVSLGEFTFSTFNTSGVFHAADGRELVVKRTSWWRGWYELRADGVVLGTARRQSFWRRTLNVGFQGAMYELAPAGFWSQGWNLSDGTGTVLVEIRSRGGLRRGAYLTILVPVDVGLLAFVYYLVNNLWHEQTAAAAAGS